MGKLLDRKRGAGASKRRQQENSSRFRRLDKKKPKLKRGSLAPSTAPSNGGGGGGLGQFARNQVTVSSKPKSTKAPAGSKIAYLIPHSDAGDVLHGKRREKRRKARDVTASPTPTTRPARVDRGKFASVDPGGQQPMVVDGSTATSTGGGGGEVGSAFGDWFSEKNMPYIVVAGGAVAVFALSR